jgi:hypothetical protein
MNEKKTDAQRIITFGDFQTPYALAKEISRFLRGQGMRFNSILEPNCGQGNFLLAAIEEFPDCATVIGLDINPEHLNIVNKRLADTACGNKVKIINADFFQAPWEDLLASLPKPLIIIGNPPWVTTSELGALGSTNAPPKSNDQGFTGLDAITGKSNFDISEWMLSKELEWISGHSAVFAMLCKTSVARKVLLRAWRNKLLLEKAAIYNIDAAKHFSVAVDACLLVVHGATKQKIPNCWVYESLSKSSPCRVIGFAKNSLIADMDAFERCKNLEGKSPFRWRSGIKHDCAAVMELTNEGNKYRNGLGEIVELEPDYVYPMLKGSQLANGLISNPSMSMLVTQHHPGEDTNIIRSQAPKTWKYIVEHAEILDRRASSIYKNRPRFSIFGVGDYSFTQWKVAISGLYKALDFKVLEPYRKKPVVLDDTSYFTPCDSEQEAQLLSRLYNSDLAKDFFSAYVFWDEKRPITIKLLQRIDVVKLSAVLKLDDSLAPFLSKISSQTHQLQLFS